MDLGLWTIKDGIVSFSFSAPLTNRDKLDISKQFDLQVRGSRFHPKENYLELYPFTGHKVETKKQIPPAGNKRLPDLNWTSYQKGCGGTPWDNPRDHNKRWWYNLYLQAYTLQSYKHCYSWQNYIECFPFKYRLWEPKTFPGPDQYNTQEKLAEYFFSPELEVWHSEPGGILPQDLIDTATSIAVKNSDFQQEPPGDPLFHIGRY